MAEELGLRERKKRETRQHISDIATGLFLMRGFDNVTVADVARAADVSVNTVFNYFKTKEDLLLDRSDLVDYHLGRVVRERRPDESLIQAVRRDFLDAVATRDWRYGFNEGADVFLGLIHGSRSLRDRLRQIEHDREEYIARLLADETDAAADDLLPVLVAGQICGVLRALTRRVAARMTAGEAWERIEPDLLAEAERAFGLLERGLGDYPRAPGSAGSR
jgi:AcrR family transcriptional regulator